MHSGLLVEQVSEAGFQPFGRFQWRPPRRTPLHLLFLTRAITKISAFLYQIRALRIVIVDHGFLLKADLFGGSGM